VVLDDLLQDKLASTTDMNGLVFILSRRQNSLAVSRKFSMVPLCASHRRTAVDTRMALG